MRAFGLAKCLKPISNFIKAFFTCGACHARVHIRVFMGLTGNCRLEVVAGAANGQTGRGITRLFKVLQVTVGVAGLTFCSGAEYAGDIIISFDISARWAKYR